MEKQIMSILMAALMGLAAWQLKAVSDLQLEVKGMMVGHASQADIQELKLSVQRLEWTLQDYAAEK
jgi:hypothetical protein